MAFSDKIIFIECKITKHKKRPIDNALNQFRDEVNNVLVLCREAHTAMSIFSTLSLFCYDAE